MAIFTVTDRDNVRDAMVRMATEGVVTCSVGGQSVTARSLDELRRLLEMIQADLASSAAGGGMRFRQIKPYYP